MHARFHHVHHVQWLAGVDGGHRASWPDANDRSLPAGQETSQGPLPSPSTSSSSASSRLAADQDAMAAAAATRARAASHASQGVMGSDFQLGVQEGSEMSGVHVVPLDGEPTAPALLTRPLGVRRAVQQAQQATLDGVCGVAAAVPAPVAKMTGAGGSGSLGVPSPKAPHQSPAAVGGGLAAFRGACLVVPGHVPMHGGRSGMWVGRARGGVMTRAVGRAACVRSSSSMAKGSVRLAF